MENIVWNKKPNVNGRAPISADVSISFTGDALRCSFTKKCAKKIFGGEHAIAGTSKDEPNRIYFCEADKEFGYSLTAFGNGRGNRVFTRFPNLSLPCNPEDFCGAYKILWDEKLEKYYIDKTKKMEAT